MDKKNLLGVGITNASNKKILEYVINSLKKGEKKYYIVTPNPEILVHATKQNSFKLILNNAGLAIPDGTGVIWAGKILKKNFKERVTGTDLMKNLCEAANEKPITVGFLGAGPKIAEKVAECLVSKYPRLKIAFVAEEWPEDPATRNIARGPVAGFLPASAPSSLNLALSERSDEVRAVGNPSTRTTPRYKSIDILFVAFGFPKQEEWMAKNINHLPVKVMIGVGGAFDYISGKVPRAPVWIQKLGFEWLFRLILQPWRLKRQLALAQFIYLVLKEKIKSDKMNML